MQHPPCLLCLKQEAIEKESHIIPSFIMQPTINEKGKEGRDKEAFIEIGKRAVSTYFGRNTTPEKIEELKGEKLSDEEITNQNTDLIMDHVFCPRCETRFSKVESYYSANNKKRKAVVNQVFSTGCDSKIACLFWLSIVWRVQAVGLVENALQPERLEIIRKILDDNLKDDEKELAVNTGKINFANCDVRILYGFENIEETSRSILCRGFGVSSIAIIVDKFAVLVSETNNPDFDNEKHFFLLENIFSIAPSNPNESKEAIYLLNPQQSELTTKQIRATKVKQFHRQMQLMIINQFRYATGFIPHPFIVEETLSEIVHGDRGNITPVVRYSTERQHEIIKKYILKYFLI